VSHQDRKYRQLARPINLLVKRAGERSAGNLHAPFDVAGDGNQLTVRFVRHSQRKREATDKSNLRSQAPFLDPTRWKTDLLIPARLGRCAEQPRVHLPEFAAKEAKANGLQVD
jgi:hypothetical protein